MKSNDKIYYHFLPLEHALSDIKHESIKVSRIAEINDPFELLPYVGGKGPEGRKPYYRFKERVAKKFGLLCFSSNWQEPLLWSHYADKHKGVALGFQVIGCNILKVRYVKERPVIKINDQFTKDRQLFIELLRRKYKNWCYENEYRILINLSERDRGHSYLPFGKKLVLRKIVLGYKCDRDKAAIFIKCLSSKGDVEVIVSRLAFRDYRIVRWRSQTAKWLKFNIIQ